MHVVPADGPTRFDYLLGVMGATLLCAAALGVFSSVPLYLAGGGGALLAAAVLVLGTFEEYQ